MIRCADNPGSSPVENAARLDDERGWSFVRAPPSRLPKAGALVAEV
jgi:hypothetical protein